MCSLGGRSDELGPGKVVSGGPVEDPRSKGQQNAQHVGGAVHLVGTEHVEGLEHAGGLEHVGSIQHVVGTQRAGGAQYLAVTAAKQDEQKRSAAYESVVGRGREPKRDVMLPGNSAGAAQTTTGALVAAPHGG